MNIKRHKIFLGLILIFVLSLSISFVFILVEWVPDQTELVFGEPDRKLDFSEKIILSTKLLFNRKNLIEVQISRSNTFPFLIEPGLSAMEIAQKLEVQDVISGADALVTYWKYKGTDHLIQTGVYMIKPDATPLSIADLLVNNSPTIIKFAFLAGWRKEQVTNLLNSSGLVPQTDDFQGIEIGVINECFPSDLKTLSNIEGFLFPGEYEIFIDDSQTNIYCEFVNNYFNSLPQDYEELVGKQGLSLYEAVILASMIQREVVNSEEASLIAGVFINRLNKSMPLQSDPTVQYAIVKDGTSQDWWKTPLEEADLRVKSPFNTYTNSGLPTAPICNPGLNSLMAVAYPKITDYFYFRASCDQGGSHNFSVTYKEHLEAACD